MEGPGTMKLQSLRFPGLQLADPNAEYSGEQVIYLDFDGEENVSYDNKTLGGSFFRNLS